MTRTELICLHCEHRFPGEYSSISPLESVISNNSFNNRASWMTFLSQVLAAMCIEGSPVWGCTCRIRRGWPEGIRARKLCSHSYHLCQLIYYKTTVPLNRRIDFYRNSVSGLQNPDTKSRWAKVRDGKETLQFPGRGNYVAVDLPGKIWSSTTTGFLL